MATTKKKAKPGASTAASKKSDRTAPAKPTKKMSAPTSKPKQAAEKKAAPTTTRPAQTRGKPPPKTYAEKLRDANAKLDVADDTDDEADVREADDDGDADESGADDTSEQE